MKKNYKTYKVLGHEVKVEVKPAKKFSFKWNWNQIGLFKNQHQQGWDNRNDKIKMPWNIYTEGLSIGEHTRTFDVVHTWFKYRGLYPLVSIAMWIYKVISKPLKKKGYIVDGKQVLASKEKHNVLYQIFEEVWDKTEDHWIKFYLCRYNAPLNSWSKKKHAEHKKGRNSGLQALRMLKEFMYTISFRDSAYREFFTPLMLNLTAEFNKEFVKNPIEHVMYQAKDISDIQYKLASEVLWNNRHGQSYGPIKQVPPPVKDMPMYNPNLHDVDKHGNVRFKAEFDMNIKTRMISVNTDDFKVQVAPNGQLQIIPKTKKVVDNNNPIIHKEVKPDVDKERLDDKQSEESKEGDGHIRSQSGKSKTADGSVSDGDISGRVRNARQVQQGGVHKEPRSRGIRRSAKAVKRRRGAK